MVKKVVEGSIAAAEAVKNCEPDVVACYPITPATHVAEELDRFYANGEIKEYIATEAELSSISAMIGASAAGARTFSATSSQGLALMTEGLYNASGMRLPMVLLVGNRALGAPLNIWNDQQDSVSERDAGWIQLYCESNQEVADSVVQAFRISEKTFIPVMVCMDGFYLTHTTEPIDVPEKKDVKKFLPSFKPFAVLDSSKPISMGEYASPKYYQSFREDLHNDLLAAEKAVEEVDGEYAKTFKRSYGVVEEYRTADAEKVVVTFGSATAAAREAVNELRSKGTKAGLLKIRLYRPFPAEKVRKALEGKKQVMVFEKCLGPGATAPLYTDVATALYGSKNKPAVASFVGGLGGKDVRIKDFIGILEGKTKSGFV